MNIVALLEQLTKEILTAEDKFLKNPKDLNMLELSVKTSTDSFAAAFLGEVLSDLDSAIKETGWRKRNYVIHRTDIRSITSSVGDISFSSTYYKGRGGKKGFSHPVEDMIGLDRNERFTEAAEVKLLNAALRTSYSEAAKVLPSQQKISKTTVMNKVHGLSEEVPDTIYDEKKKVPYLYIEADEDHVAEQHGRFGHTADNKSFISKLIYVYEEKKESLSAKGRNELVNVYYFSGLYPGAEGNKRLWEKVRRFIENNYDTDELKHIYISGDGAPWIKSGTIYLDKAVFCADKYHLMQYINAAAGQMLDEKEHVKDELWHLLYSGANDAKKKFDHYTAEMKASADKPDKVEKLRTYVLGNWMAVRRTLRRKHVKGCSAEGHVSHMLSDRLSSRPMGWSQTGADRMSKLRCYAKNNGSEKIIELVRYSRSQRKLALTGTEDAVPRTYKTGEIIAEHYDQARSYIERIQAHFPEGTAKKSFCIREHLWEL